MTPQKQVYLLNMGSKIGRVGTGIKPLTIRQALKMLNILGVKQ